MQDLSRWMWVSTKPAQTIRPPPCICSFALPLSRGARAAMRPSLTPMSVVGWSGVLSASRTSRTTRSKSIALPTVSPFAGMLPDAAWHLQPDGQDAGRRKHMVHALREKAAISGVGETAYTRGTTKSGLALQLEASLKAIDDAGLKPRDIDGVIPYFPGGGIAEDFVANLGLPDLTLSLFVPMGGATSVAAIQTAAMAVATGVAKNVRISVGRTGYSGARVSTRLPQFPQFALAAEFEAPIGMFAPAQLYAQGARRHMHLYGTPPRHFPQAAVTTRQHAILNAN